MKRGSYCQVLEVIFAHNERKFPSFSGRCNLVPHFRFLVIERDDEFTQVLGDRGEIAWIQNSRLMPSTVKVLQNFEL